MSEKNTKKERAGEQLGILLKAFQLSLRIKSRVSLFVSIAGLALALLPALTSVLLSKLTDQLQSSNGTGEWRSVVFLLFTLYAAFILKIVYRFLRDYFTQKDSIQTTKYIKRSIMEKCCRIKYSYLENEDNFNEKLYFVEEWGGAHVAESMQSLILCVQDLASFVSLAIVVGNISIWLLVFILITSIPACVLGIMQNEETFMKRAKWSMDGNLLVHYFLMACGDVRRRVTMPEFRFLQMYPYIHELWSKKCDTYLKDKNAVVRKHVIYNCIADTLRNLAYVVILFSAAKMIIRQPALGVGLFTLLYSSTESFQTASVDLFQNIAKFQDNLLYIKNYFDLMDIPDEEKTGDGERLEKVEINFDQVTFKYPGSDKAALDSLSLHIRAGEKIAIVGENGSGKSTFINLLTGMFAPTEGSVKINGKPISEQMEAARRSTSVVFQEFGRYEATLRRNITVSEPDREVSDEDILNLMKATNSYTVYEDQPNGLNEMIGTLNKKATNLSGGQWQKIALTRAAFRKDASLMILDEPTAALDPISEAELYQDFASITGERTTILISHRLGITPIANRILVFHDGKVVEDGTHEELMALNGKYANMFRAQAEWYL